MIQDEEENKDDYVRSLMILNIIKANIETLRMKNEGLQFV